VSSRNFALSSALIFAPPCPAPPPLVLSTVLEVSVALSAAAFGLLPQPPRVARPLHYLLISFLWRAKTEPVATRIFAPSVKPVCPVVIILSSGFKPDRTSIVWPCSIPNSSVRRSAIESPTETNTA